MTEVHLKRTALSTKDMEYVQACLQKNSSIRVLDLENNKIDNNGAILLADGLRNNSTLVELNLLGQGSEFGDMTLVAFIDMLDFNVTLQKVIWRLNSRKSFAINKLLVRNNTIKKWVCENKSVKSILPAKCNVADISVLFEDGYQGGGTLRGATLRGGSKTGDSDSDAELTASGGSGEARRSKAAPAPLDAAEGATVAKSRDSGTDAAASPEPSASAGATDEASTPTEAPASTPTASVPAAAVSEEPKRSVGKLDAAATLFANKPEAEEREQRTVGKLDAGALFSNATAAADEAGDEPQKEVGKINAEAIFAKVGNDEPPLPLRGSSREVKKLNVEERFNPGKSEVASQVDKPEVKKMNPADRFKPGNKTHTHYLFL